MNNLDWPGALQDIKMIKDHFDSQSKSVSITGFCMGGALTFASLSSFSGWKVGAPFYGVPDLNIFRLDKITAKVIAHFGRQDPLKGFSDVETAEKLAVDAKTHKYPIQVNIWDGVSHAFCNQDSLYFNAKKRDEAFAMTTKMIA